MQFPPLLLIVAVFLIIYIACALMSAIKLLVIQFSITCEYAPASVAGKVLFASVAVDYILYIG